MITTPPRPPVLNGRTRLVAALAPVASVVAVGGLPCNLAPSAGAGRVIVDAGVVRAGGPGGVVGLRSDGSNTTTVQRNVGRLPKFTQGYLTLVFFFSGTDTSQIQFLCGEIDTGANYAENFAVNRDSALALAAGYLYSGLRQDAGGTMNLATSAAANPNPFDGAGHCVVVQWAVSAGVASGRMWVDGVEQATSISATAYSQSAALTEFSYWVNNMNNRNGTPAVCFNGHMPLFARFISTTPISGKSLSANPWQMFATPARLGMGWSASGALAAAAIAQAQASAALTTQITLAGAANAVGAAAGSLTTQVQLAGAALSIAAAAGSLTTQISLAGAAITQAAANGALTTQIPLAGIAAALATAAGALGTQITLAGTAGAVATATATLTTQIRLVGAAAGQATAAGDLTAPGSGLAGAAQAVASAGGLLTTAIRLDAAALAQATATGSLSTQIPLAGAAQAIATAAGSLTTGASGLAGTAAGQATAAGALATGILLAGSAQALASATGELTIAPASWPVNRRFLAQRRRRFVAERRRNFVAVL